MAFQILKALCGIEEIHQETEMTEEQQVKPDSLSTQLDLTHVHDDSPYDIVKVVKELRDKTAHLEKRLHEVETLCKKISTERMEGNPQRSSNLLPSRNDDEGDEQTERTSCDQSTSSTSHITPMIIATPGIKKVKVSIHNVFTLVCIPNLSIELCTVAICKDLLSYCNSCICTWKSVVHLGTVTM